jgi:hypothetical protein
LRVGIKRIMRRSTSLIFPAGVDFRFMGRGALSVAGAFVSSRILPMSRTRTSRCLRGWSEEGVGLFTWGRSHSQNQTEFKSHSHIPREAELKIFQEGGNCAKDFEIQSGFVSARMCAWESKRPDPPVSSSLFPTWVVSPARFGHLGGIPTGTLRGSAPPDHQAARETLSTPWGGHGQTILVDMNPFSNGRLLDAICVIIVV